MKQYRIVVKGDSNSAKYYAQRRFLLIFWIPLPFLSIWYGGENFYDDAVDVIKAYKSRYKKIHYLED